MRKSLPPCRPRNAVAFLALIAVLSLASCSSKTAFLSSSIVPAAEGWVQVRHTDTNYAIRIRIVNLAPSRKLDPPQDIYIVWVDTESDGIRRLGSMQSSTGFLSKALKASLDATIPYKPIRIMITAESERDPLHPGMYTVLRTGVVKIR